MNSDDRIRGVLNTMREPWWKTTLAKLFGQRIQSDGHIWSLWRGRYYFIH